MGRLAGAFTLVFMDERTLYAVRDRHGVRPCVLGRLPERGWVVASETAALDIVGATLVREVEPGEVMAIDDRGLRSRRFAPTPSGACACSSSSTWPGRTPPCPAGRSTRSAGPSAAGLALESRSRRT